MSCESEQYRFARIEAYHTALAHLEEHFRDRAVNLEEMEAAVAERLAKERLCASWRRSEPERAGCLEGMRLAADQFLFQYRDTIRTFNSK